RFFAHEVAAIGEIGRQRLANPVVELEDPTGDERAADLRQHWERLVDDVQYRGHAHQVHAARGVGQGLGGGVEDRDDRLGGGGRELPAVRYHGRGRAGGVQSRRRI